MAKDEKNQNDPKKKQPQNIMDILNMDGIDDIKFDETEAQKELEKLEKRRELLEAYKLKLKEYEQLGNDDYKIKILKELAENGLVMMETMRQELEDNPRGADVEYVSSLMNSINNVVDSISKMDFFKEKMKLEQEKMQMKERLVTSNSGNITQNNMYVTTNDIIKMIKSQNEIVNIDVDVEKIE